MAARNIITSICGITAIPLSLASCSMVDTFGRTFQAAGRSTSQAFSRSIDDSSREAMFASLREIQHELDSGELRHPSIDSTP